jgi:cell wall-associated NlpC family hydrolase
MKPGDPDFEQVLRLAAEGWHGTPFIPLHGQRGVGVDCANLVYGVLLDAGVELPDVGAPTFGFSPDSNYLEDLNGFCDRLPFLSRAEPPILPGDVLVFQVSAIRQHMALALSPELMLTPGPHAA